MNGSGEKVMSVRWVAPPRSNGRNAVKVAEAHEGFGLPLGCNTPVGGYGPSQDEKPWGRGLRALLGVARGVLWTSRRIVRTPTPVFGSAGGVLRLHVRIRFAERDAALGKDDMKLDQFGGRDDTWLAR